MTEGSRGYLAGVGAPSEVLIVDTSDVGRGRANAGRIITRVPLAHNAFNQSTYRLDYSGHPYLINFGESTPDFATRCTDPTDTNFDAPRMIDIRDELHPRVVAKFMNEVDDPANCALVANDRTFWHSHGFAKGDFSYALATGLFLYDVHHCTPDRLHDPTILACATMLSGLRVYDIRDPLRPKEIAYYNTGTRRPSYPNVDVALARPSSAATSARSGGSPCSRDSVWRDSRTGCGRSPGWIGAPVATTTSRRSTTSGTRAADPNARAERGAPTSDPSAAAHRRAARVRGGIRPPPAPMGMSAPRGSSLPSRVLESGARRAGAYCGASLLELEGAPHGRP